jgi:hypothetical protein
MSGCGQGAALNLRVLRLILNGIARKAIFSYMRYFIYPESKLYREKSTRITARRWSSVAWSQNQPRVLNRWQLHRPLSDPPKIAVRSAHVASLAGRDDREVRGVDRARLGACHERPR